MADRKKLSAMYKDVLTDSFPEDLTITIGDKKLQYRKRQWAVDGNPNRTKARLGTVANRATARLRSRLLPTCAKGDLGKVGLRYGDNPGQEAALYELRESNLQLGKCEYVKGGEGKGLVSSISGSDLMESGKHVGKSNLTDVDNALSILKNFDEPTAVIMKHNNPCGAASRATIAEAYKEAYMADRLAAFGGVAALNRPVDMATAEQIMKQYLEVVAAPDFEKKALEILLKKKNMRLIRIKNIERLKDYRNMCNIELKSLIDGGLIVQQSQTTKIRGKGDLIAAAAEKDGKDYAIKRKPTEKEYEDLLFAWKVVLGVVSNAIVFAKNKATVAICPGEQDRVGAVEIAIMKAHKKFADRVGFEKYSITYSQLQQQKKEEVDRIVTSAKGNMKGSVIASDGFFPFRDSIDVAAERGVTAIIQPGGSINDHEVIEACNEHDIAMVFTGQRVFRH